MKKKERKTLSGKLLVAINLVLKDNNAEQTNKIEKSVVKSVKRITKNSKVKKKTAATDKIEE